MFLASSISKLIVSYINGSYSVYDCTKKLMGDNSLPFGPYPCMPVNKIYCVKSLKYELIIGGNFDKFSYDSDLYIFSGGMPKASYGDRYTISIFSNECEVVFDFDSKVLDFIVLNSQF